MDAIAHVHAANGLTVSLLKRVVRFLVSPLEIGPNTTQLDIEGPVSIVLMLPSAYDTRRTICQV